MKLKKNPLIHASYNIWQPKLVISFQMCNIILISISKLLKEKVDKILKCLTK